MWRSSNRCQPQTLSRAAQPKTGKVEFANVGEGTYEHGKKSYRPDATTVLNANAAFHYLLYKQSTVGVDFVTLAGAGDTPLGPSEDIPELDNQATSQAYGVTPPQTALPTGTGLPIAIMLLGAVQGTVRVVTDGTVTNNAYVKCAANGQVTLAVTTDVVIGKSVITSDMTSAAGDVITMIPILPGKHPF